MPVTLGQEVKASSDGSFHFPAFREADCNKVRLSAEKAEDLWLRSGHNIFYEGDNGTTPLIEVPQSGVPAMADITLGIRGGLVSFRVMDTATSRFIWASFSVEKVPVANRRFGSMLIATGRDGSPDTLLLPPGPYEISIVQYSCGKADYFARIPPRESLTVTAGQRTTKDISVNVRLIRAAKTHSNPHGKPCIP